MSDDNQEQGGQDQKTPYTELELQFMVTQPAWGREASQELNNNVSKNKGEAFFMCLSCKKPYLNFTDKCSCGSANIQLVREKEQLWSLLSYYTRDLRLGNLQGKEQTYCLFWLSLAGDFLRTGNPKSFLASLSRVIDLLEISQSRGGFYRKRMSTVTSEHYASGSFEPSKKGLLNNKPKGGQ